MIIPNHNYTPRERTVCELLAPLGKVRHLLNIGMRRPDDPRNLWWINICQANGTETHVLEVFEPNCQELRAAGIENVTCGDVRDVTTIFEQPFDVILWWHGPEHLERSELPAVFDDLWRLTAETLIVGCPLGDEPQGICYGNHHERHLSCWQPAELAALGFETSVVRDERPYPHITAWRSRTGIAGHGLNSDQTLTAEGSEERAEGTRGRGDGERGEAAWTGAIAECELQNVNCKLTDLGTTAPLPASPRPQVSASDPHPSQLALSATSASSFILHPSSFRVAIIFDDKTRPETTGVYCRAALRSLVDVEFFHPDDLAQLEHVQAPRSGFDLYLAIDDGLDYSWPGDLHPCAYWAIDTHMDFERCLRRAAQFDFVFAAQRDGAERLRQAGVRSAQWLPLACDPIFHGRQDVPTQYDVCFVGNLFSGPRIDLVRLIRQYFHRAFVGNAYFEEMARIYSASKIVFNRSLRNDVNMRVFEALASGSLLVTNDLTDSDPGGNGQHELFRDGVHLVTYSDGDELLDKLRYYLRRVALRERIAAAGRAEVLAKHTYRHRMEELLRAVTGAIAKCKLQNEKCELEERASAELGARNAERAEGTRGSGDAETQGRDGSGQRS